MLQARHKILFMKIRQIILFLISILVFTNLEVFGSSKGDGNKDRDNAPVSISQPSGQASYYGRKWNGRKTSSGEVFNTDSFTCAHRTLPFGTLLKVTNKKNGKTVVVRVTDRGPFVKGRIVDLSMAAAKQIDMIHSGVAPVEIAQVFTKIPTTTDKDELVLPELELFDPVNGNYYTMSEWQKRDEHRKEIAKAKAERQAQHATAKAQPRYRVAEGKATAKAAAPSKAAAKK